jgi:hypothetical protein
MSDFKPGDVLDYHTLTRPNRWCREGVAIVEPGRHGGAPIAVDTYWSSGFDNHILTEDELATAQLRFNINDYDELDRYARGTRSEWETYHPLERQEVCSQHGLETRYFIRKGAKPDLSTRIANLDRRIEEQEQKVRTAKADLEWMRQARENLARKAVKR